MRNVYNKAKLSLLVNIIVVVGSIRHGYQKKYLMHIFYLSFCLLLHTRIRNEINHQILSHSFLLDHIKVSDKNLGICTIYVHRVGQRISESPILKV